MFRKYKREKRGDVVQYIIVLAFVVSLLTVFAPQIKEVMFGSTNDSVAKVEEVTKPMDEKESEGSSNNENSTNSGGTTPPPPPIEDPKPKTYTYAKISLIDHWKFQSRSYWSAGAVYPDSTLVFSLKKSVLGEDMKKIAKNGTNLRFFDSKFNELPFWIGQWGGTDQNPDGDGTNIWMKLPATERLSEIIMVYGDENLPSKSNGDKIFRFYDDFSSISRSKTIWKNISDSQIQNGMLTLGKNQELVSKDDFSFLTTDSAAKLPHLITFSKSFLSRPQFEYGYTNMYVQHNQENIKTQGMYEKAEKGTSFNNDDRETDSDTSSSWSPYDNALFILEKKETDPNYLEPYTMMFESYLGITKSTKKPLGSVYLKSLGTSPMQIAEVFILDKETYMIDMAKKGVQKGSFLDEKGIIR